MCSIQCFVLMKFCSKSQRFQCCRILERKADTNAFVRTTTAVTMFNAGVKVCGQRYNVHPLQPLRNLFCPTIKVNVIPSAAEAYVNLRIHSAQNLQEVKSIVFYRPHECSDLIEISSVSPRGPAPHPVHGGRPASQHWTGLWVWPVACQLLLRQILWLPDH